MTAYIGYKNLFLSAASTTASNEATGYEKENCYDWKLFDFWKPGATGTQTLKANFSSAVTADYLGVYGHNLGGEGVTIKLQYSTAGSSGPWTTVVTKTPLDKEVLFIKFDSTSAADWQVELTNCTVDAKIGVMSFGEITALPAGIDIGFTPAIFQPYKSDINLSQTMSPLGNTTKREPIKFDLNQSHVSEAGARQILTPIYKHFETTPGAFFAWNEGILINSLVDHSHDLTKWTLSGTPIVTSNTDIAPDGTLIADTVEDDDGAAWEYVYKTVTGFTTATDYYVTAYIKKDSTPRSTRSVGIRVLCSGGTSEAFWMILDTSTGEYNDAGTASTDLSVSDAGEYWQCRFKFNDTQSNTSALFHYYPAFGNSGWTSSAAATGAATFGGAYVTTDLSIHNALGKEREALYIYPDQNQKLPSYSNHNLMKAVLKLYGLRD